MILCISQIEFSNVGPGRPPVGAKRGVVGGKEPSLPKKGQYSVYCLRVSPNANISYCRCP